MKQWTRTWTRPCDGVLLQRAPPTHRRRREVSVLHGSLTWGPAERQGRTRAVTGFITSPNTRQKAFSKHTLDPLENFTNAEIPVTSRSPKFSCPSLPVHVSLGRREGAAVTPSPGGRRCGYRAHRAQVRATAASRTSHRQVPAHRSPLQVGSPRAGCTGARTGGNPQSAAVREKPEGAPC